MGGWRALRLLSCTHNNGRGLLPAHSQSQKRAQGVVDVDSRQRRGGGLLHTKLSSGVDRTREGGNGGSFLVPRLIPILRFQFSSSLFFFVTTLVAIMFLFGGGKPPPPKIEKQHSADPGLLGSNPSNSDVKPKHGRTTSDPVAIKGKLSDDDDDWTGTYSSSEKNKYKNGFRDSGGFENQSVQQLQNYAAYKAEETTDTVNNCLRIAEDIKGEAERTLVTLHQQGEQIGRTHVAVVNMEQDLSRGEKLLGSLGGMFSMPWRPKKGHDIKGPVDVTDNSSKKNDKDSEKREDLGLSNKGNRQYAKPTSAMEKVEIERAKQDDGLNDLSDVLGQLKGMAVDMGSELERQNKALDHLNDDIDEMNDRVKGANQRARRIVGK